MLQLTTINKNNFAEFIYFTRCALFSGFVFLQQITCEIFTYTAARMRFQQIRPIPEPELAKMTLQEMTVRYRTGIGQASNLMCINDLRVPRGWLMVTMVFINLL